MYFSYNIILSVYYYDKVLKKFSIHSTTRRQKVQYRTNIGTYISQVVALVEETVNYSEDADRRWNTFETLVFDAQLNTIRFSKDLICFANSLFRRILNLHFFTYKYSIFIQSIHLVRKCHVGLGSRGPTTPLSGRLWTILV